MPMGAALYHEEINRSEIAKLFSAIKQVSVHSYLCGSPGTIQTPKILLLHPVNNVPTPPVTLGHGHFEQLLLELT